MNANEGAAADSPDNRDNDHPAPWPHCAVRGQSDGLKKLCTAIN